MAKLKGPLLSLEAAGSLGDSLIYQTWRGRPYVRKLTNPRQAPTVDQAAIRTVVAICSRVWSRMPETYRADWASYMPNAKITDLNKMVGFNIDRCNTRQYDFEGAYTNNQQPVLSPTTTDFIGGFDQDYPELDVQAESIAVNIPDTIQDWSNCQLWGVWRIEIPGPDSYYDAYFAEMKLANLRGYQLAHVHSFVDRSITPGQGYGYSAWMIGPSGARAKFDPDF